MANSVSEISLMINKEGGTAERVKLKPRRMISDYSDIFDFLQNEIKLNINHGS